MFRKVAILIVNCLVSNVVAIAEDSDEFDYQRIVDKSLIKNPYKPDINNGHGNPFIQSDDYKQKKLFTDAKIDRKTESSGPSIQNEDETISSPILSSIKEKKKEINNMIFGEYSRLDGFGLTVPMLVMALIGIAILFTYIYLLIRWNKSEKLPVRRRYIVVKKVTKKTSQTVLESVRQKILQILLFLKSLILYPIHLLISLFTKPKTKSVNAFSPNLTGFFYPDEKE